MAGDLSTSVRALRLDDYQKFAVSADRSGFTGDRRLRFLLLGLFGEVGSLLSELKKKQRDRNSYLAYERSSLEETGDVLWYLQGQQPLLFATPASGEYVERTLLVIAARVGRLVRRASDSSEPSTEDMRNDTTKLFAALVDAASDAHINLEAAALANIEKVEGRWPTTRHYTPLFDEKASI